MTQEVKISPRGSQGAIYSSHKVSNAIEDTYA